MICGEGVGCMISSRVETLDICGWSCHVEKSCEGYIFEGSAW